MPSTDVIFRIGTLGVTQAQAELGAVVGALAMIGREMVKQAGEMDKFSDAWGALSQSQRQAVQAMDTATKGWLPTMAPIATFGVT